VNVSAVPAVPAAPSAKPSAAPSTATPQASATTIAPDKNDGCSLERQLIGDERCYQGPPPAITKEREHLQKDYTALAPAMQLPKLVKPKQLIAALPRASALRQAVQDLFAGHSSTVSMAGGFIDDKRQRYLVALSEGGLSHYLLLFGRNGRLLWRQRFNERITVYLKNVLGSSPQEIIVRVIQGTSLSRYPTLWQVYQVDQKGSVRQVLSHPKHSSHGSKFLVWKFMNHFDFLTGGGLKITTIHSQFGKCATPCQPSAQPWQPKLGEVKHFRYDRRQRKYIVSAP